MNTKKSQKYKMQEKIKKSHPNWILQAKAIGLHIFQQFIPAIVSVSIGW